MSIIAFHQQNKLGVVLQEFVFQTNSGSGDTFDPSITYTGGDTPIWEFESGHTENGASISVLGSTAGLDSTTQTVTLKVVDLAQITGIDIGIDNIVGNVDFSTLTNLTSIKTFVNSGITGYTFPTLTGVIDFFSQAVTGLSGTLDLTDLQFTTGGLIALGGNNTTDISFNTTPQTISRIDVSSTSSHSGNLNLTMFAFAIGATTASINISNSSSITTISLHATNAGTVDSFNCSTSGLTSIDLNTLNVVEFIQANDCTSLTSVTLGTIGLTEATSFIKINNCTSLSSYVNLTGVSLSGGVTNIDIDFSGDALTAAAVNNMLVDLDSNLPGTAPATANIRFNGGTNAAPDTTSGGFNGSAAKTSLQGKGYTVNTN